MEVPSSAARSYFWLPLLASGRRVVACGWHNCTTSTVRRIMAYASHGMDLALPPSPGKQNFLHVEDAAAIMVALVRRSISGVWPATHPDSYSYHEIARIAYAEFGRGGAITEAHHKRPFTERFIPDSSPLYDALGIGPHVSMRDGIKQLRRSCAPEKFGELDAE